jgi:protein arginine kinase activator
MKAMLCEKCGKNTVTTHLKQVINGDAQEMNLCSECAEELGYGFFSSLIPFNDLVPSLNSFLGGIFTQTMPLKTLNSPRKCSVCGSSFEDIAQDARVGCANCYRDFYTQLLPSIQRIHGKTKHIGKIPASASNHLKLRHELKALQQNLNDAVSIQDYENAAKIRDRIREIEGQVKEQ